MGNGPLTETENKQKYFYFSTTHPPPSHLYKKVKTNKISFISPPVQYPFKRIRLTIIRSDRFRFKPTLPPFSFCWNSNEFFKWLPLSFYFNQIKFSAAKIKPFWFRPLTLRFKKEITWCWIIRLSRFHSSTKGRTGFLIVCCAQIVWIADTCHCSCLTRWLWKILRIGVGLVSIMTIGQWPT